MFYFTGTEISPNPAKIMEFQKRDKKYLTGNKTPFFTEIEVAYFYDWKTLI